MDLKMNEEEKKPFNENLGPETFLSNSYQPN